MTSTIECNHLTLFVAEYFGVLNATAWGLIIMGGLGYIIKLVHYPVKEILVGVKAQ